MLLRGRGLEHFGASTASTAATEALGSRDVVWEVRIQRACAMTFSRRILQLLAVKDGCCRGVNRRLVNHSVDHPRHGPG